jgi:hypothetical protein
MSISVGIYDLFAYAIPGFVYLTRTLMEKVNALMGLQPASGDELSALMPSVLDRAFKGKL